MKVSPALVRELAESAGFDIVRFGPPDPGDDARRFQSWIDSGRAGEMHYLERNADLIRSPQSWIPDARSSICLGYDYGTPAAAPELEGGGKIARYARGRDYHRFLGNATRRLRVSLETAGVPHGSVRVGTDAVPILERALALRSGVGFLAKSAGIISPELGPYLLLSELITPLELPFDLPAPGSCGTCTRCIDACPTDAITAPFEVDARRCISYTTIELRGSIPRELRAAQGEWLFGCDVCLEVCPFTSKGGGADSSLAAARPDLQRHSALDAYSLVGVLELSAEQWATDWTGTAIRRATHSGLRRNAAVVLGNLADPSTTGALERALDDDDAVVREHAAWALGRVQPRSPALERRLAREQDSTVRGEIVRALDRR